MVDSLGREIVTITLDCGHTRTWNLTHGRRERFGKRDKAVCKYCDTPELISKIIDKAVV